jgi:hypothetical protein
MGFEVFAFCQIEFTDTDWQLVTEDLVRYMDAGHHHGAFLVEDPQWAMDFAPNGTLVGVGDVMTRKRYAKWVFYYLFL